jgi:hypothetical protein
MATPTLILDIESDLFQQTSIDFPDTCPYCNGRGIVPRILHLQGATLRVIETVQPCLLCESKGVLKPERFIDFLTRKSIINAHLYNKFGP